MVETRKYIKPWSNSKVSFSGSLDSEPDMQILGRVIHWGGGFRRILQGVRETRWGRERSWAKMWFQKTSSLRFFPSQNPREWILPRRLSYTEGTVWVSRWLWIASRGWDTASPDILVESIPVSQGQSSRKVCRYEPETTYTCWSWALGAWAW